MPAHGIAFVRDPHHSPPARPLDVWRVCGTEFDPARDDRGCTCTGWSPVKQQADAAVARLTEAERAA